MRAAILPEFNQRLYVRDDVQLSDPGPGEVRVRLAASGVCHTDLSAQNGSSTRARTPCILGHEGAGVITGIGPGVEHISEGDHVILAWVPACGRCRFCLGRQPNLCMSAYGMMDRVRYTVDGAPLFPGVGVFATFCEETTVPATSAIPIPADVPLDIASLIGCGVMTGVGAALNTAHVQPGSSVLVLGCGGVGINVIQGARIAGAAEIVAVDVSETKHAIARRFGATHAAHPDDLADVTREITGGDGFDYVLEVIGRAETIRQAWDLTRRGGATVVVGVGRVDEPVTFNAFELSFLEKHIHGCVYGSADPRVDFHRLLRLWRQGQLQLEELISIRIDLNEVNEAFDAMTSGEVVRSVIEY